MLEEVGEAAAAGKLVGGADVIPDVDRHLRQPVILAEDDRQAVAEDMLLELDLRVRGARGPGGENDERQKGSLQGDLRGMRYHAAPAQGTFTAGQEMERRR